MTDKDKQTEEAVFTQELADEWESCARCAAEAGRPDDDATIIHFIFYFNFDYGDKLSNDSPNYYGMVEDHQEMLREIRNYGRTG